MKAQGNFACLGLVGGARCAAASLAAAPAWGNRGLPVRSRAGAGQASDTARPGPVRQRHGHRPGGPARTRSSSDSSTAHRAGPVGPRTAVFVERRAGRRSAQVKPGFVVTSRASGQGGRVCCERASIRHRPAHVAGTVESVSADTVVVHAAAGGDG